MSDWQHIHLPFGSGLDRASGIMLAQSASMADLRNAELFDGKLRARRGHNAAGTLQLSDTTAMGDVLALLTFEQQGQLIAVGWLPGTQKVYVFKGNTQGSAFAIVDDTDAHSLLWTTQAASGLPVVFTAEVANKIFFAQYWNPYKPGGTILRAVTRYYDPTQAAGSKLANLNTDFGDGSGAKDVYFNGVVRHLAYLMGWGWGSFSDPDRQENIWVMDPDNPLLPLDPNATFQAGAIGSPVLNCVPLGGGENAVLKVFKYGEAYDIFGYDLDSFGIKPADDRYGLAGPKLAINVGGVVIAWAVEGPRIWRGAGKSEDLAVPLNLGGPEPADLADAGDTMHGWCYWDPIELAVHFLFPKPGTTVTRDYKLSLRTPSSPKWSYDEHQLLARCGTTLYSVAPSAPSGHPAAIAATAVGSVGFTPNVHNTGNAGDETIEFWLRDSTAGGAWYEAGEVAASGVGNDQALPHQSGLVPTHVYDFSPRYRKNGLYNAGAENTADPSSWPDYSAAYVTLSGALPAPTSFTADPVTAPYQYGPKWYEDAVLHWANPSLYTVELAFKAGSHADLTPPAGSTQVELGAVATYTDTRLVPPSATSWPGIYTYWVRFGPDPLSDWAGPVEADFSAP